MSEEEQAPREIIEEMLAARSTRRGRSTELARYADVAMYAATPDELAAAGEPVVPRVTLLSMTPLPVQTLAAAAQMYRGLPVRDSRDVSMNVAMNWFTDMSKTVLQAPLEFVDLHFLFEGVTRAWANQLERQRTAVYVQESLRFAVKENAEMEVAYPPSIADKPDDHPWRAMWNATVGVTGRNYNALINAGMPAEEARGLLPLNITTRVHYKTDLRALAEHAGMRLCSQAQQEWKQVWGGIYQAVLEYGPPSERWQQEMVASLFKPICYRTGRCEFRADTDRFCSIRERVERHHANGEPPTTWVDINPLEPLMDGAARQKPSSLWTPSRKSWMGSRTGTRPSIITT